MLYFESDKNYINVIVKDGQPKRVRGTLKKLDELISKPSNFIRCHSAFIVNLYFIKDVTGNAQGLRLNLGNNAVPVSRKYIRQIRNKLQVANV